MNSDVNEESGALAMANGETSKIINFSFPDSVRMNKMTKGKVIYSLQLDTIEESEIIERFLFLYVTSDTIHSGFSASDIKKKNHRIFTDTIGNGMLNFQVSFTNTNNYQLNCIVQDVILLKNTDPEFPMLEYIRETAIINKVVVY